MATLRQYFDTDFSKNFNFAVTWNGKCGEKTVDIIARLHCNFDSGACFVSFFLPACSDAVNVCAELVLHSKDLLNQIHSSIQFSGGFPWTKMVDYKDLFFSGRMYIYSETQVDSGALRALNEHANRNGIVLEIRSLEMVQARSKVERPFAFISHDTRDKDEYARPLAVGLEKMMCPVWYDEFSLRVGMGLRESIESGLKDCKKCVLLLSKSFLSNKGWTKVEFNSVFTRELIEKESVVLPVWIDVSVAEVFDYSPSLANRVALSWSLGIDEVLRKLYRELIDPAR